MYNRVRSVKKSLDNPKVSGKDGQAVWAGLKGDIVKSNNKITWSIEPH